MQEMRNFTPHLYFPKRTLKVMDPLLLTDCELSSPRAGALVLDNRKWILGFRRKLFKTYLYPETGLMTTDVWDICCAMLTPSVKVNNPCFMDIAGEWFRAREEILRVFWTILSSKNILHERVRDRQRGTWRGWSSLSFIQGAWSEMLGFQPVQVG